MKRLKLKDILCENGLSPKGIDDSKYKDVLEKMKNVKETFTQDIINNPKDAPIEQPTQAIQEKVTPAKESEVDKKELEMGIKPDYYSKLKSVGLEEGIEHKGNVEETKKILDDMINKRKSRNVNYQQDEDIANAVKDSKFMLKNRKNRFYEDSATINISNKLKREIL